MQFRANLNEIIISKYDKFKGNSRKLKFAMRIFYPYWICLLSYSREELFDTEISFTVEIIWNYFSFSGLCAHVVIIFAMKWNKKINESKI